jgi:hypothetical protein
MAAREFPLARGHGKADYALYIDGELAGVIEANDEAHLPDAYLLDGGVGRARGLRGCARATPAVQRSP